MSAQRPRRRRPASELPPAPDDWAVADDEDAHLTLVEGPTMLAGELARLARRPGWAERLGAARVEAAWEDIVGPDLVAHCEPVRLAGRVLTVRAASPVWATQLRYLTAQLIERAEAVLGPGSVREINLTVGPLGPARIRHTGDPARDPGRPDAGAPGTPGAPGEEGGPR